MNKKSLGALVLLVFAAGCERAREPNKIVDGIPVNVTATVAPAQAAQHFLFLHRDLMNVAVPVMNKFTNADSQFSELTSIGGGSYQFTGIDAHYGNATFTLSFRDNVGAGTDPIATRSSSSTFKTMVVSFTGGSSLFNYSATNATITLDIDGNVASRKRMLGSTAFTGVGDAASHTLTFSLTAPGPTVIFQGFSDGEGTATGTGGTPSATTTLQYYFSTDRNLDGNIAWDGRTGTFHIEVTGPGYVVTPNERLLLD